jgi:hypothetical protein
MGLEDFLMNPMFILTALVIGILGFVYLRKRRVRKQRQ